MNPRHFHASYARSRGIAAVELALALPLMALLLIGITEGGRVFSEATLLTRGVQLGARYAAENATTGSTGVVNLTADLVRITQNLVATANANGGTSILPHLAASNVTVTSPTSNTVEVSAVYTYTPIFHRGLPVSMGGGSGFGVTLTARTRLVVLP